MRLVIIQLVLPAVLLCFTAGAQEMPSPIFFTNRAAISNGRAVLAAVISGGEKSETNVQALIGSQVVFVGGRAQPLESANLMVWTNVLLEVELRPSRDVRPHSITWSSEVLGTLKSIDFKKRVIHIETRPEDWRVRYAR